jgi:hypothetical protein
MARAWWYLACLLCLGACGEIRVVAADAGLGSDIGDDATADGSGDSADGGDVQGSDTAAGCTSDDECKGIKGKTPCKDPICDKQSGQCKLQARMVGSACVDPFNDSVACQETRCDGSGQCVPQNQADGTQCGIGACGNACKSGQCKPATPVDYDDNNPCTNDYCDQGKIIAHDKITNPALTCDDGDVCTQGDACIAGVCQGAQLVCSDGIDCTLDTCAKTTGCVHTPKLDACSDGNPCTKDACDLAVGCTVVGSEFAPCDDGNACSDSDFCDKGVCKGKPSTDLCPCASDSECASKATDLCSVKYKCDVANGVCAPKLDSVVICDTSKDGACLKTACDLATGSCETLPVTGTPTCDDGDACTASSICKSGGCVGVGKTDCADANACTADLCASDVGCVHSPTGGACDDGNPCTVNDTCQGTTCAGGKKPCDDGLLCTFDSCEAKSGGCQHLADQSACNDDNPCTTDICDVSTDCQHAADDAATCDDGNVCTVDSCKSGKCVTVVKCDCAADLDCDDKNPCTTDVCQAGKCVAKNADGNACSPGDKCQKAGSGSCSGGSCVAGNAPIDCSSVADACNAGVCDASKGTCQAVAKPAGTACDDGNGCSESDVCEGGTCTAGAPVTCEAPAGKPCVHGQCQSTGPASHICTLTAKAPGIDCDDGLFCTTGEVCDNNGECVGTPVICASPSACILAACEEAKKSCVSSFAGSSQACDDGLYCTVGDACNGNGSCSSGPARVCAGGACLIGVCDEPTDQCLTQATANCCKTDAECDDGFPCTSDVCDGNACSHSTMPACCNPTIWGDNFDAGTLEGMTLVNSSGSLSLGWQLRAGGVFNSNPTALYYGDPSQNNFDFGASNGTASTPSIVIPSPSAPGPSLKFAVWFDTESGDFYDILTVSAVCVDTGGGSTTIPLWSKPQAMTMKAWQVITTALPASIWGQSCRFDFTFNTVDGVANSGAGVYLDDISVEAACP